jgi:hypothetical protein
LIKRDGVSGSLGLISMICAPSLTRPSCRRR